MSSPGRPSPIPELINFQKWKEVSEGERLTWAQPPPRKGSKYPQPVCKTKEMLGSHVSFAPASEKGEGQLNPSMDSPLSGPAISGSSGAPGTGVQKPGSQAPVSQVCSMLLL